MTVARELTVGTVSFGAGVVLDLEPAARALEHSGVTVIRAHKTSATDRPALRERIANCDLGIIEADYAIASTGTFAMLGSPDRPNSLTLLPPTNLIVVDADRILPDLAALIAAVGPETIVAHRLALVTGPEAAPPISKS